MSAACSVQFSRNVVLCYLVCFISGCEYGMGPHPDRPHSNSWRGVRVRESESAFVGMCACMWVSISLTIFGYLFLQLGWAAGGRFDRRIPSAFLWWLLSDDKDNQPARVLHHSLTVSVAKPHPCLYLVYTMPFYFLTFHPCLEDKSALTIF